MILIVVGALGTFIKDLKRGLEILENRKNRYNPDYRIGEIG